MLNISVLVKCIIDPVAIQWNYYDGKPEYMSHVFNKTDLHGLQWACDYKEKYGAAITVVLAVPRSLDVPLDRLKRFPIEKMIVIQVSDEAKEPVEIPPLLAEVLRENPFDLIICGSEGEDEMRGVTPIVTAELLGIPSLTHIHQIKPGTDGNWNVQRKAGRGIVHLFQIKLPALIGVSRSVAELTYIPRQSASVNRIDVMYKEARIPEQLPSYRRWKLSQPEPHIHYLDVPEEPLAQHRILQISGVLGTQGNTEKKKSELSSDFMRYTARHLEKWLQEGK
jgi:electron transfer flavoprotein alpha/beta subunit